MSAESDVPVKNTEANQPLKTLGKYQIEKRLGQGGMGTVYLALNTDLKKLVALKVLPRDKAKNPVLVRRFKAEAQAAGQLEHPNIVAVYDSGEADGFLYIAMEYVDGIDLFEQVRKRGVIPVKRSIDIIKQVAAALQHAYEHNIVHRDIKPSNLLLKHDGTVKVTDLGLARSIDDTLETNITRAGTTVGTVDYMAPEQARNSKAADIRSDIYSLGCTWYQMLTGEAPFPEGSVTNKLQAHAIKPLPDPRELNENVPEGLFAVLQRMTAKKADERYQTPAELIDDLNTSKLTKAAFSNEIFSDLSDSELQSYHSDNDDGDSPADDVGEVNETPVRKKRPTNDLTSDEPSSKPGKRKPRSRVEEDSGSLSSEKTQPAKSKSKSTSKGTEDANEERPRSDNRRSQLESEDDEELDELSSAKAKLKSQNSKDNQSSNTDKSNSATSSNDKRSTPKSTKSLPPKRMPIAPEKEEQGGLNIELLKYVGMAAGLIATVGCLGWLIFLWSSQVDTAVNPFNVHQTPAMENATQATATPPKIEQVEPENTAAITVVEPPKTPTPDRPVATDYEISRQPLPAWAAADAPEPADLPAFTVGPGVPSATHFLNLQEALLAADKAGGVIRIDGNGPFLLPKTELGNAKKVVITPANPQDQPLIIVPQSPDSPTSGLVLSNGLLEVRGLHFALERSAGETARTNSAITVIDGQLLVRKCSFTATGDGSTSVTALTFSSQQDSQNIPVLTPDLLLDRVTVRGNGVTGLKIDRTAVDAVIEDSLLVTGRSPAIEVTGILSPGFADAVDVKPRRTIRVIRSTLSARNKLLEFSAPNTSKPPTTGIYFLDSICSAEGAHNTAVLLSAVRWPTVTSPTSGWLTNLNWTSQSSLYTGFERLIDLEKSSFKVANLETWQRVWGKKFEPAQLQSLVWHEAPIGDLSTVMPQQFDNSRLPFHDLKSSRGGLPGCTFSQLVVPGFISPSRLAAMGHRPKLPSAATLAPESASPKRVNLGKEDLGAIINRNDWPSGTVFEATGHGLQMMTPVKIEGKSLRVIFRQDDGAPLRIQPKTFDQKSKFNFRGVFDIEKGTLEVQSAVIESQQSPKGPTPPWLIYCRNGSVILRGCQLTGPMQQELPQHQGLIEWTTTGPLPARGQDVPFLSVNDSLLITTGVGIRFQSAVGNLFVRNAIIAARGYGLDLQPFRSGGALQPAVDLQNVTFSAAKAALRVEAAPGSEVVTSPMRVFVDNCTVITPLEVKPGEASESTVIECAGPVIEQKQMEWWGNSNGFSKDLKSFLRQSNSDPVNSAAGWQSVWGDASDIRLLTGSKGVQLRTALPNKLSNLKTSSFLLDSTSEAATWAEGARPIGADIRVVEELAIAKKAPPEAKTGMSGQTSKTGVPVPGKKNNPGF